MLKVALCKKKEVFSHVELPCVFSDLHWHGARSALIAIVYEVPIQLF